VVGIILFYVDKKCTGKNMEIDYRITKVSKEAIEEFLWIKSNFKLGELGSRDDREIVRLLENIHYPHIKKTLKLIDKYGSQSSEIGDSLLKCNDNFVFSRQLSELFLFIYLYEKLKSRVTPIRRVQNQKSPDISVKLDDYEYLIEVFSPMDYYGYQVFSRLLTSCLKNLDLNIGFEITIDSQAQTFDYTYDFPQFREVYDWIDQFCKNFLKWIRTANKGDVYYVQSPAGSLKLKVHVESIEKNSEIRSILWGQATRSTDTILYFRINDPAEFSKTQWGVKIEDKLQKQQAGEPRDKVLRILTINFSLADTSDLNFLNDPVYFDNFSKYIRYLASDIKQYPPFDVILACELSFECSFSKPINLSNLSDKSIENLLEKIYFKKPINEIKKVPKEQVKAFWDSIINTLENKDI